MRPEELREQIATRAEPLPEERAVERGGEDREAEAAEVLRDSEERVAEASGEQVDGPTGEAPGDGADEHRRSGDSPAP